MPSLAERRRIARLVHRFGFGPRPGEFSNLLAGGFDQAAEKYLNVPSQDAFADNQDDPVVRYQGSVQLQIALMLSLTQPKREHS